MDEFLRLYLTGKRADDLKRFRRFRTAIGLLGALFAVIPVFVNLFGAKNAPLCIALTVLGFLLECAASILSFIQKKFADALVELENAANEIEKRGEERENYKKLYEAWREAFGKRDLRQVLSAGFNVLGFAILASAEFLSIFTEIPEIVLPLACIAAAIVLAIPGMLQAAGEGTARAVLYERAGWELDEIKRSKFGLPESKIFAQSESARGFSALPVPVAAFLKDETEKEDFRAVSRRSSFTALFLGIIFGVLIFVAGFWDKLDRAVGWTVSFVVIVFALMFFSAQLLPLEAKKREIYRRNYEKLTDGSADTLRKQLQGAWIRQQKRGNIMFACFLLAAVILGMSFGVVGYILDREQSLIVGIGAGTMVFLIPAAIVSLVIWTIMYAVYRKRVRPVEEELKNIIEEERMNERHG